ncbi:ATP-binding protein [Nitrospira sp. Nam74]
MVDRRSNRLEANQQGLMAELARLYGMFRSADTPQASPGQAPALDRLCTVFGLSPFERDVLLLCAGIELDSAFAEIIGEPTFELTLAKLPGAHWSALSPGGPLRHWRLIDLQGGNRIVQARLRIDERVLHYLLGIQELDARLAGLVTPVKGYESLAPSHLNLVERIEHAWRKVGDAAQLQAVHLLGTAREDSRAVAAAACACVGLRLYAMSASDVPTSSAESAAMQRLWEREAALMGAALLIEIDDGDGAISPVRRFVERARCAVLVSGRDGLGEWSRRTISIDVNKPRTDEQRSLWRQALGHAGAELNGSVDALVAQFDLSAGTIRRLIDGPWANERGASPSADDHTPGKYLWNAARTSSRGRLNDLAQRIEPAASWDDIVLPPAQMQALREIAMQVRHRTKVYETWGFARKGRRGLGISALFAGASGTGKTMAAEVLANDLQLDLYRIDLSQVVSKYIGETEKNLRRVFDAAEEGAAILLFDEADALFGKRSDVRDSHDRYANIEVSYLLQRMEAYRGLAILTTNMKHALDPAFLRRIRFVVPFPFPDVAQRAEMWRTVFPSVMPTAGLQIEKLARLTMPGGHIRNIAVNAAFLAADANEAVQMKHVLQATRTEYAKLDKPLSDAEVYGWVAAT